MRCDYQVSASRLWDAITHPVEMRKWFFESMHSFIPEPGFTTRFNVRYNDKVYIHIWRVKEVIPGKKIRFVWEYGNYEGSSLVSFELFPAGDRTSLQVTHSGTETFSPENPDFSRTSCSEGWKYLICQRLKQYLDSHFMRVL
jgi:uncharacterized protein YndB with AHSA1/START domain